MTWYDELREEYRPSKIQVLFVGESPPDPGDAEKRFYYSPTLFGADNLFRGLMKALYDADSEHLRGSKNQWLDRFQADGHWLLDLTDRPVNRMSNAERTQARREAVPGAVDRILGAEPLLGTVICHAPTFKVLAAELTGAGGAVLHDPPIPFPLGNHRTRFVELVREALLKGGIETPIV